MDSMKEKEQSLAIAIPINTSGDILKARNTGRKMAENLGFPMPRAIFVSTVITELSDNLIVHAGGGEIILDIYTEDGRDGLSITARDEGPGIDNINQVLKGHHNSNDNFGCGLPGLRSLADVFHLESTPENGTTVQVVLWPT